MRSWRLEVAEAEAEIQRLENWRADVQSGAFRSGPSPDGVSLPAANDISVEEIAERIAVQERRLRLLMEREAAS